MFLLGCWRLSRQLVKDHLCCQVCWVTHKSLVLMARLLVTFITTNTPPFLLPPLYMSLMVDPPYEGQLWTEIEPSHEFVLVSMCAFMHMQPLRMVQNKMRWLCVSIVRHVQHIFYSCHLLSPYTPKDHLLWCQERFLLDMVWWNRDHLDDGWQQEGPAGGPISWPHAGRGGTSQGAVFCTPVRERNCVLLVPCEMVSIGRHVDYS